MVHFRSCIVVKDIMWHLKVHLMGHFIAACQDGLCRWFNRQSPSACNKPGSGHQGRASTGDMAGVRAHTSACVHLRLVSICRVHVHRMLHQTAAACGFFGLGEPWL